jgi:hypothetical protein
MTVEIVSAIGSILIALFGAFLAFMRYLVTHFLKELKPNSGKSLADKINRLEERVDNIYKHLMEKNENR